MCHYDDHSTLRDLRLRANIEKGSGNVYGTLGYENIKVGSIAIDAQEMDVVNASTSWEDGFGSGIMGLGYPTIVQIHPESFTGKTALQLLEDRWLYPTVLTR